MSRLLHHHNRILARPNRCHLWRVQHGALPAYGREGEIDGRVQFQAEVEEDFV